MTFKMLEEKMLEEIKQVLDTSSVLAMDLKIHELDMYINEVSRVLGSEAWLDEMEKEETIKISYAMHNLESNLDKLIKRHERTRRNPQGKYNEVLVINGWQDNWELPICLIHVEKELSLAEVQRVHLLTKNIAEILHEEWENEVRIRTILEYINGKEES